MRKIGIYLSILVLLLASCKNDSEILRNMKPLEQYYKKYTVQQLVEKIMKDKGAKSVGIHFEIFESDQTYSGLCVFRASILFSEGEDEGYGSLKEDCGLDTKIDTHIKYYSDGLIRKSDGSIPKFFDKNTFLFEQLDLNLRDYNITKTTYDMERGDERVYFQVDDAFQKKLFQTNFPSITESYRAEELAIMYYKEYQLAVRFFNNNQRYSYYETLTWSSEKSDKPKQDFEREGNNL